MPEPLWKKVQREHLKRMGGQGRCSYRYEDGPDSVPLPWLVVESKSVKVFHKHILDAVEKVVLQATHWSKKELRHLNEDVVRKWGATEYINGKLLYRLGIVRYHVTGTKYDEDIICIKAIDFETWFL